MTDELLMISDWLGLPVVTILAMESLGVYSKPVYNLLEEAGREVL